MALLELRNLSVKFDTPGGAIVAVDSLDLDIGEGECVAIVGESGSGKSQTFLAALGLLAANGTASGSARLAGRDTLACPPAELDRLRGPVVGYVFQDALGSLTPHLRIGEQLVEVLRAHRALDRRSAWEEARRMLERVQVADAAARLRHYPHELSGGTRQRVAIAAALMPRPQLLIADEPTTALDVTVQAQLMDLFRELRRELDMALALVTHDLGVVAGLADRVVVMYAGRIVEEGTTDALLTQPAHPYSAGLLDALPQLSDQPGSRMRTIAGTPPQPGHVPAGCAFHPRCAGADRRCTVSRPSLARYRLTQAACHHPGARAAP